MRIPKPFVVVSLDKPTFTENHRIAERIVTGAPEYREYIAFKIHSDRYPNETLERQVFALKSLMNVPVFLDNKINQDPKNTWEIAATAVGCGASIITVGHEARLSTVRAAVEGALDGTSTRGADPKPLVLLVIDPSWETEDDQRALFNHRKSATENLEERERRIAAGVRIAKAGGAHGVVCPAHRARWVKEIAAELLVISPAIRPTWALEAQPPHNMENIETPFEAFRSGVDGIVLGAPITNDPNPDAMFIRVLEEIL